LRVATGTIAGFSSSIFVASSGNYYPGLNPSIALDDLNNKYLSYRYFGYDYLGYAYSDNSGIYSGIVTDSVTAVKDTTSSIRRGDDNSFVSYYYAADDTINLMLVDTKVPEGTARLSGKANNLFGWELLSSDYAKMGGAKYYCIDETNTCDPVTSLTSATDFGNYSASSSNVDAIYLRLKDWAKNTTSITLSSSSIVPERESLDSDDLNRNIVQEDLVYQWKAMPKHPSRYWIKTIRYKSYAPKYKLGSHYLLKRYWKIQTNLYKYKKNTRKKLIVAENNYQRCLVKTDCSKKALKIYKKELKKYQNAMFKVRVTFYYNRKIVKMLKSKNSDLKKLSIKKVKKKLWLKYYNKSTKKWENVTKVKAINNPASNKVKNSLLINISYFKQKNTLFTIGVK